MQGHSSESFSQLFHQLTLLDRAESTEETNEYINNILRLLGIYTGAGRCFIFDRLDMESETYSNTFEWCADGVTPEINELSALTFDDMPYWISSFKAGKNILIPCLEDVRETMPSEYEILKMQDIHSEIACPIFYRGSLSGFIGLDDPREERYEDFLELLSLVGGHLGSSRENLRMVSLLKRQQNDLLNTITEMDKERQMLTVLSYDCISVFRVNLLTDTAEVFKVEDHANSRKMLEGGIKSSVCYSQQIRDYYDHFVVKSTAPDFLNFLSRESLMRKLEEKDRLSYRFQSLPNAAGQVYFEIRITKLQKTEDSFQALVDFRSIDEIVCSEREHQRALEAALDEARTNNEIISALSKIYFLIYRINVEDDLYEEVSGSSEAHRLTGVSGAATDRMHKLCSEFVDEEYRDRMLAFLDISTLGERLRTTDTVSAEYLAADGDWHLARFVVQKRAEGGDVLSALFAVRIISEEKRRERRWMTAAEEARRASEAKSEFLSRMSHDIRTPMSVIMGFVEIAKNNLDDRDRLSDCLEKISSSRKNLQQLIDDVLDISRIESGEFRIMPQICDVRDVFAFYSEAAECQARAKGIHFVNKIENVLHPHLLVDQMRLGQIYMNLLSNAVKYTPEGGTVRFEISEQPIEGERRVKLITKVIDNGIGMSKAFMNVMYSEFSRAVDTRVNTVRGSGLGLAIVKKIVDLMGGTIDVKSQLHKGTAFTLTLELPYTDESDLPTDAEAGKTSVMPNGRRLHLLVAEDNDLNFEIETELLGMYSITCTRARDGIDCVNIFKSSAPGEFDAILMDMQMPVMTGPEASLAIRALPRRDAARVPIIAVTANAYHEDVKKCMDAGMNAHLSKPLNLDIMIKTIYSLTEKSKVTQ